MRRRRRRGWPAKCFLAGQVAPRASSPTRPPGLAVAFALLCTVSAWPATAAAEPSRPAARAGAPAAFAALGRLGEWVRLGTGERAWRPDGVAADWQPYRAGHWAWTSDGWFWVSAEPWAWATYHHGRWRFDPRFGWAWLPGDSWAPAAVVWRSGQGVVGWAPATDDGFVLPGHWTFLPSSRFDGAPVPAAAIAGARVPRLLASTRVASAGPPAPRGATVAANPVDPPPDRLRARAEAASLQGVELIGSKLIGLRHLVP
jgi:hypothetical protein